MIGGERSGWYIKEWKNQKFLLQPWGKIINHNSIVA